MFYHISAYLNDDTEVMLKEQYGLNNMVEWVQVSADWFEYDKKSGVYIEGNATDQQLQETQ